MLTSAVDTYLAVRRTAGFQLKLVEYYLRGFARFASARGDTHVYFTRAQLEFFQKPENST